MTSDIVETFLDFGCDFLAELVEGRAGKLLPIRVPALETSFQKVAIGTTAWATIDHRKTERFTPSCPIGSLEDRCRRKQTKQHPTNKTAYGYHV